MFGRRSIRAVDGRGNEMGPGTRVTTKNGRLAGDVIDIEMQNGRPMVAVKYDDGMVRPRVAPEVLIVADPV